MRILLIEDHRSLADIVVDYLSDRGHSIDTAADGISGLHFAVSRDYDAIVLDRMLPGLDGATLCGKLRHEAGRATPVLMLTALSTTADKLAGFAAGADDYLVKPFDLPELEARLHALHRRATGDVTEGQLRIADLVYDTRTLQATRAGRRVALNPTTRKILEYLMRNTERVVSRTELEQQVWGTAVEAGEVLRVQIHHLRDAIDREHASKLLQTVRGAGYRIAAPDGL